MMEQVDPLIHPVWVPAAWADVAISVAAAWAVLVVAWEAVWVVEWAAVPVVAAGVVAAGVVAAARNNNSERQGVSLTCAIGNYPRRTA